VNLFATLGLNSLPFLRGLGQAGAGLAGFRTLLSSVVAPLAGMTAAFLGVSSAAGALKRAVGEAAQMEDLEGSFTTLLGSAAAAQARMKELADFAAQTPFDMPGIAATSKLLQSFTGDALATGEGLRLVGDAAAAVGQPLEAVSMWFGRLYAALREGQPLGEPLQNLTQLGLVSGDVRKQLMALQGTALDSAAVMDALQQAFGRNTGAMERLSQTFNGRLSTLQDTLGALYRELGTPIRDALKPFLERSTKQLEGLVPMAQRVGEQIGAALNLAGVAMANGTWPQLLGDVVAVALGGAVNTFSGALVGAIAGALSLFTSGEFWKGAAVGITALGAALLQAFMRPLTYLQAGMDTIVGKLFEAIGKIPVVGEKMGLEGFKGASFEENLADREKNGFFLRDAAESATADAIALTGFDPAKLTATFQEAAETFKEGFRTGDIFDVSAMRERLAEAFAGAREAMAATREKSEDAPATGGGASDAASSTKGLGDLMADRLAKIGGFIGGAGGPALDYARRTATATERVANDIRQLPGQLARILPATPGATWA